jgi:nucleoid DNA-binding protein
MAKAVKFFAWAAPVFGVDVFPDHTWVTTYDNRKTTYRNVRQVAAANEFFWFCWGVFHVKGGTPGNIHGILGEGSGDLALSQCLVTPNASSNRVREARGTIFQYGRHGLCHQLANQVLYATGISGVAPLTVAQSRGYLASVYWYGTYGKPEAAWDAKRDSCGGRRTRTPESPGGTEMMRMPDEFEIKARNVLGDRDPTLLAELLALREEAQRAVVQQWPKSGALDSSALTARNQRLLDQAGKLLGPKYFEDIFGFPLAKRIALVNPAVDRKSGATSDVVVGMREPRRFKSSVVSGKSSPHPAVTLKHLAASLAEAHELSKKETEAVLGDLVGLVTKHLKKGDRIRIGGLGVLQVRKRAARMGRNPATGETIKIRASKKIAFRAAKDLKESI